MDAFQHEGRTTVVTAMDNKVHSYIIVMASSDSLPNKVFILYLSRKTSVLFSIDFTHGLGQNNVTHEKKQNPSISSSLFQMFLHSIKLRFNYAWINQSVFLSRSSQCSPKETWQHGFAIFRALKGDGTTNYCYRSLQQEKSEPIQLSRRAVSKKKVENSSPSSKLSYFSSRGELKQRSQRAEKENCLGPSFDGKCSFLV